MIKDRAFTTCDQSPRAVHNMDCWTLYIEAKSDVQPVAIVQWEHLSSGRDRSCLNTYLLSNTKCSWPQQAAIAASTATPGNTWKERAHKTRALLKSAPSWLNVRQRASRLQVSAFTATGLASVLIQQIQDLRRMNFQLKGLERLVAASFWRGMGRGPGNLQAWPQPH